MGKDVSIVITTHYRNEPLREAIESALTQTHGPVEVVVVDDSGERHAEPVAADYDVEYVPHERNRGQVAGWHTGVAATDGSYVQLLDDDDRLDERKVAAQVEILEESTAGVAYCGYEGSDGEQFLPPPEVRGDVLHHVLTLDFHVCTTSTLLTERSVLERVFPLPLYQGGPDIPLKIELAAQTEYDYVDRPLVYRRLSPDSQGHSMAAMRTRQRVLDEYEGLYDEAPEYVHQRASALAYRLTAVTALRNRPWSGLATACYAKAALANPETRAKDTARCVLSLFGRPGITLGGMAADAWRSRRG